MAKMWCELAKYNTQSKPTWMCPLVCLNMWYNNRGCLKAWQLKGFGFESKLRVIIYSIELKCCDILKNLNSHVFSQTPHCPLYTLDSRELKSYHVSPSLLLSLTSRLYHFLYCALHCQKQTNLVFLWPDHFIRKGIDFQCTLYLLPGSKPKFLFIEFLLNPAQFSAFQVAIFHHDLLLKQSAVTAYQIQMQSPDFFSQFCYCFADKMRKNSGNCILICVRVNTMVPVCR